MQIFFSNQLANFPYHLQTLQAKKVMFYNLAELSEKISIIDIDSSLCLDEVNLDFLFDYQIFPEYIMGALTQWKNEKRAIKVGDTILQQVYLPPIKNFSQKIIFGVRISAIIDEKSRKGFSYETLEGHVEKGNSTFTIEEIDGKLIFKIHTFSKPESFFSKLLGPIFSLPYQKYCTKKALENVKKLIVTKK
jgi:uncharacterized protein (UPF0548 family)